MPLNHKNSVSVVIPMRNAATTVLEALKTISMQEHPIHEIIVVDNVSKDNSCDLVKNFAKKTKIPIRLLVQKKDKGVASSYNWGTKEAKSEFVIFMTSDCALPTRHELGKLVEPLLANKNVVASFSTSVLPRFAWDKYNFWEKLFAARMVDDTSSMMVLKFDAIRKSAFFEAGAFDEINFGGDSAIGGEDADLNTRLKKLGQIVRSQANSLHLHYMSSDYTLQSMLKSRKMYARSNGRYFRKSFFASPSGTLTFLIRPAIAVLPFIPPLSTIGIAGLILYSLLYTKTMFTTAATLFDTRIFLVPFINIFVLYYELFWIVESAVTYKK